MHQFTQEQTAAFAEYCERERAVTLQLYGLVESDLTDEQKAALDAYMAATQQAYLDCYGPMGPRGAGTRQALDAGEAADLLIFLYQRRESLLAALQQSNTTHDGQLPTLPNSAAERASV